MTNPPQNGTTPEPDDNTNSVSGGASYTFGHSAIGGVSKGAPAPEGQRVVRRRGAPDEEAATEGGSQPGTQRPTAHAADTAALVRSPVRVRRRHYQRRQRPHVCSVRMSDDELARVSAAAHAADVSVAGFFARSALSAASDPETSAAMIAGSRETLTELFDARRHLGQVGNNLNQLARAVNAGAHPADAELAAVLDAVHRASARVQAAVDQLLESQ
ncbi:plasmid mobilization protein [Streptomyces sp. NBC_00304]|uniref:plasmid mobilization protein n=1 Tax=Streptomyces sp. NBC_00304 TaxID=2975706 RepID=UPI003FA71CA6